MYLFHNGNKHDHLDPGPRLREKNAPQLIHSKPAEGEHKQQPVHHSAQENTQMQHGDALNADIGTENEHHNRVFGIMGKQNEITTLWIQQQCLSSFPKKEIPVFGGDPLNYHAFNKVFENDVERKTEKNGD